MKAFRKIALILLFVLINSEIFSDDNWKFYVSAMLVGIGIGNPFGNPEDKEDLKNENDT